MGPTMFALCLNALLLPATVLHQWLQKTIHALDSPTSSLAGFAHWQVILSTKTLKRNRFHFTILSRFLGKAAISSHKEHL